ncbi:MAG: metallophosphoesterase family protein [Thermodesulfobacteriota bacterium]
MSSFRFVHAADLHLDAPFQGLSQVSSELGQRLRQATFQALDNLIQLCVQQQADFLLISGDVYNQEDRSLRAQLRFREALANLSQQGISVYLVHGNHDPVGSTAQALTWPENVHVFSSWEAETQAFIRDGSTQALIHGASHTRSQETRNLARNFKRAPQDVFQIGLLHCNLERNTGHAPYAPCSLQDLAKADLDYWALGHVHSGGIFAKHPYVVYPGNIQGLNILEQGPRGCYVLDVHSDFQLQTEFHPLDVLRWAEIRVDIQNRPSLDRLEEAIFQDIQAQQGQAGDRGLLCRIVLSGRGNLHSILRREEGQEELLQRLREYYQEHEPLAWIKDLRLETSPELDLESRRRQGDFLAEVLDQAQELLNRKDCRDHLHQEVLAELYQHRRAKRLLQHLSQEEAQELLRQAEILCADLLQPDADKE